MILYAYSMDVKSEQNIIIERLPRYNSYAMGVEYEEIERRIECTYYV